VLLGGPPHELDTSLHAAIRQVAEDPPRPPRTLDPSLPRPLAAILARAVAPAPGDRYATASELAADLRRWLDGEPVLAAERGSLLASLNRRLRRHPLLTAAAGGFATAAVAAVVLFVVVNRMAARLPATLTQTASGVALVRADGELLWERRGTFRPQWLRIDATASGRGADGGRSALVRQGPDGDVLEVVDDRGRTVHEEPVRMRSPYAAAMNEPLEVSPNAFVLEAAELLPAEPGPELLALSFHPKTFETLIEIRDADGRRVHRAWWHPGHVYPQSVALFTDEAGEPLIVAAGIANRLAADGEVLPVSAKARETRIVFALRPEAPSGMLPVWLVPEGEREADERDGPGAGSTAPPPRTTPVWYRWLAAEVTPGAPLLRPSYLEGAALHVDYPEGGSLHLTLDGRPVAVVWPDGMEEPPYAPDDVRRLDPADAVAPGLD